MCDLSMQSKQQNFSGLSGFTLIEVLTVIIIIGIITTFSALTYQSYIIKSQIATMFHDAEAAKLIVTNDYYRLGSYSSSTYATTATDFTTPNSDCISSIDVSKRRYYCAG